MLNKNALDVLGGIYMMLGLLRLVAAHGGETNSGPLANGVLGGGLFGGLPRCAAQRATEQTAAGVSCAWGQPRAVAGGHCATANSPATNTARAAPNATARYHQTQPTAAQHRGPPKAPAA